LARWQAEWVAAQLRQRGVEVELVPITTAGDRRQQAIPAIGGQGVFTKEIQRALTDGRIDLAVHSLKDLPTGVTPGVILAAVPERAAPGDVLVLNEEGEGSLFPTGAATLPPENSRPLCLLLEGAVVGTGSLRRRAQLLHVRRDLQMKDVRGNVETRLRKLDQGDFDALILAEAGLRRLGLAQRIAQTLPPQIVLPAVGQGALGLEIRCDDKATHQIVAALDHPPTHAAVRAERAMLSALQGGCLAPIAALGRVDHEQLTLTGRVIGRDGVRMLEAAQTACCSEAELLGSHVAEALLAQGAGELIRAAREA
jgi:hydroxymethylbilane synthase